MERSDGATPPLSPELEIVDGDGGIGALMLMSGRASSSNVQVRLCLNQGQRLEDRRLFRRTTEAATDADRVACSEESATASARRPSERAARAFGIRANVSKTCKHIEPDFNESTHGVCCIVRSASRIRPIVMPSIRGIAHKKARSTHRKATSYMC